MVYKLKYSGTFPNNNDIVISCSFFKLPHLYRGFDIYINGLLRLIEAVNNYKYHLIIYYDHSLDKEEQFLKIYEQNVNKSNVLFCKYYFPKYIGEDGYHKGLFGTFIRAFPIFSKNIKYKCLFISDIDLTPGVLFYYIKACIERFLESPYKIAATYPIGYEERYHKAFDIENSSIILIFGMYFKKHQKIKKMLFNFLNKINNNNDPEIISIMKTIGEGNKRLKEKQMLFKYHANKNNNDDVKMPIREENESNVIKFSYGAFSYGIDEIFLNKYATSLFIKKKMGVFYTEDRLDKYFYKIFDASKIGDNIYSDYFKNIFEKNYKYISDIRIDDNVLNMYKFLDMPIVHKKNLLRLIMILNRSYVKEKLEPNYKILKNFVKQTIELCKKEKSAILPGANEWLVNLYLHNHKTIKLHPFYISTSKFDVEHENFLLENTKIYSLKKLIKIKKDINASVERILHKI